MYFQKIALNSEHLRFFAIIIDNNNFTGHTKSHNMSSFCSTVPLSAVPRVEMVLNTNTSWKHPSTMMDTLHFPTQRTC